MADKDDPEYISESSENYSSDEESRNSDADSDRTDDFEDGVFFDKKRTDRSPIKGGGPAQRPL